MIKFSFDAMLIILIWANSHSLLKDLSVSLTILYFLSMVLWSSLVVPIIRNVLTYVVLFPTSRDLSPIEDASVVIPTCFLHVLHVLPVVACLCSHFMFWLIFWHLHSYLYIYCSHSGIIKFCFLLPTQCLSNSTNRCQVHTILLRFISA
jgi:hypothetical protein